jgi:hypothetical protein
MAELIAAIAALIAAVATLWGVMKRSKRRARQSAFDETVPQPHVSSAKEPTPITVLYSIEGMIEAARAVLYLDGKEMGVLTVDKNKKTDKLRITLPRPGTYEYSIQSKMTVMGIVDPETGLQAPFNEESNGRGTIEVEKEKEFILSTNNIDLDTRKWYATLSDKVLEEDSYDLG